MPRGPRKLALSLLQKGMFPLPNGGRTDSPHPFTWGKNWTVTLRIHISPKKLAQEG